ncbi:MAG: site-2 protease family protein [Planctomycetota bacterium]
MFDILLFIPILLVFLYSVIIHECAHAVAAYKLGDPTAYSLGRITLNPIKHIDPVWTILMPLLTFFVPLLFGSSGFIFGGAKPVPINPYNFRNPDKGMMISSLAGPLSNFSLAILGFIVFFLSVKILPLSGFFLDFNKSIFTWLIIINILLGIFNLIPIPPLDGSRVLRYLLPWHMKETLDRIEPFGIIIVIVFVTQGGTIFISKILNTIYWLLESIAR